MSRPTPTYEECYALVLLRECLHMTNLELSDRPDIVYNNKSGIEVVSALFEEDKRLETILMRKKENKKTDHLPPGYTQYPYFIVHPLKSSQDCGATNTHERCTSEAIELIEKTIDKKKEKVDLNLLSAFEEEISEKIRLFYVALTRAKEKIIIKMKMGY